MDHLQFSWGSAALVVGFLGAILFYRDFRERNALPGPTRWPYIGNAYHMPHKQQWLTFSAWKKVYGDVIHMDVFGQKMLVVNSLKMAQDLLSKRSSIYSDRPYLVMGMDLVGYNKSYVFQGYGESWKLQRRMLEPGFGQPMAPSYYPLQEQEAKTLVRNLLKDASDVKREVKLRTGTVAVRVVYGYYVKDADDPFLVLPQEGLDNFSSVSVPGRFLVDYIPALRYLPAWLPGMGFLKIAEQMKKTRIDAGYLPYNWTKAGMETGETLTPNLCTSVIKEGGGRLSDHLDEQLAWSAGAYVVGGFDTSSSQILTCFIAMIKNPEIQKKARAEIFSVVGEDRLPNISDVKSLPYIRSLIAETLRHGPPVPLCFPHTLKQDDIYNGMYIKKGTGVIVNIWHILNDPDTWPDPRAFNPDRFENKESEIKRVLDVVFGFGKRTCPGFHFAFGTLYSAIVTTLATCEVLPALDENGKEILPEYSYTTAMICLPENVQIRLRALSPEKEAMLCADTNKPRY